MRRCRVRFSISANPKPAGFIIQAEIENQTRRIRSRHARQRMLRSIPLGSGRKAAYFQSRLYKIKTYGHGKTGAGHLTTTVGKTVGRNGQAPASRVKSRSPAETIH